jgi:hypothetical protein
MTDPFAALGLPRDASEQDVRAARRRLAKALHPDAGGDAAGMADLNDAADRALRSIGEGSTSAGSVGSGDDVPDADSATSGGAPGPSHGDRFATDIPSFIVETLPAETFEALLVVASWIGEVLDDDPPYHLEVVLREPVECWCGLDIVPDAGSSTVSLQVASIGGQQIPDVEAVRDVWISHLNQLDWD